MINDFKQEKDSLQLQTIAPKEFLSFKEAAVYLKISESNLYKKTSKRVLKFFKPNNGKLYFKRCDLDAWVLQGECNTSTLFIYLIYINVEHLQLSLYLLEFCRFPKRDLNTFSLPTINFF